MSTVQPSRSASNVNFESVSKGVFSNTLFYRVHLSWNKLLLRLREIIRPSEFKRKLLQHLWNNDIKDEYEVFIGLEDTVDYHPNSQFDSEPLNN